MYKDNLLLGENSVLELRSQKLGCTIDEVKRFRNEWINTFGLFNPDIVLDYFQHGRANNNQLGFGSIAKQILLTYHTILFSTPTNIEEGGIVGYTEDNLPEIMKIKLFPYLTNNGSKISKVFINYVHGKPIGTILFKFEDFTQIFTNFNGDDIEENVIILTSDKEIQYGKFDPRQGRYGKYSIIKSDYTIQQGEFKSNKREGVWSETQVNGTHADFNCSNDKIEGKFNLKRIGKNNQGIITGSYKDNKKDGIREGRYQNQIMQVVVFQEGVIVKGPIFSPLVIGGPLRELLSSEIDDDLYYTIQ